MTTSTWSACGRLASGTILDDDLYLVSGRATSLRVDEGRVLYYQISHNGHTGEPLQVKVKHAETGSAVQDGILGEQTHDIVQGTSGTTRGYLTHRNDGSDGDAEFIVEILPGDGYEIDAASASATVIVRDKDPLPVLGFRNLASEGNEADGTIDFWVDIVSPLPSLLTVTVDYEVYETGTNTGDIVPETGTLTFAPGETNGLIQAQVVQDLLRESGEGFSAKLTNPANATFQDGQTFLLAWGVINDNEPDVSLTTRKSLVNEGDDIGVTFTRTGNTARELDVWLRVRRVDVPGQIEFPQVTFAADSSTAGYTVSTVDDDLDLGTFDMKIGVAHPVYDIGEASHKHMPRSENRPLPSGTTSCPR